MLQGFPGLSLIGAETLKFDRICAHLFVFRSPSVGLTKAIWRDSQKACPLITKLDHALHLLSAVDSTMVITPARLGYLLEGID